MKTFRNVSPDWGDYAEVTPADYRKQSEIYGLEVEVTSDGEGIYADGVKVAEPIKETQRATHTPPRWHVERPYGEEGTYITDETTALIAKVYPMGYPASNLTQAQRLEQQERAAIIAAAPEMLQALKDALRICRMADRYFPKSIRNSDRFDLCNLEANSIRKAIEKATGVYPT